VTQVSPQDGATGRPRNTNVKVTFSEAMDPATINGSTFQLRFYDILCDPYTRTCNFSYQLIPATVRKDTTDTSGRTYVLDPSVTLYANKRYRVQITTGVRDVEDGLSIPSNKAWSFTTGSSY
jgi:Bacterial Ig-like domain